MSTATLVDDELATLKKQNALLMRALTRITQERDALKAELRTKTNNQQETRDDG